MAAATGPRAPSREQAPAVLLVGAFGQRNPGDNALQAAFQRALGGWRVVATSRAVGAGPDGDPPAVASGDPTAVMRMVAGAGAIVFGGGTVFKELRPATGRPPTDLLRKALALALAARGLGKPVAMVGVGAGRLHSRGARALAGRLVRQADLLILRDDESAQVLADAGAPAPFRVGADAAWTVLEPGPEASREGHAGALCHSPAGNRRIVVALSHEADDGALAGEIADAVRPLLAGGVEVVLHPWQVGGPVARDDIDLARAVRARLGGATEILVPPADLAEARAALAGAHVVLGLRFHALVTAAAAGIPFVALAHEPKLAGLARRLGQTAVAPGDPRAMSAALAEALRAPRLPDPEALARERAGAQEGMRLLRVLLSRGRSDETATLGSLPLRPVKWAA